MRTIKFRAWDKEYEKMTYFDDEDYDYRPPFVFRLDQVFKKDSNYDDYEDFKYNDVTDRVEVMQYTGLKDKNGAEIYEGDIVYIASEDENAFVLWDKKTARYIIQFKGWCADFDNFYGKDLEVIGNIYDNPNLLEKVDEEL